MTALDLRRSAFIYAQALDNKGGTEYWRVYDYGTKFDRLTMLDQRTPLIRAQLDEMNIYGRYVSLGSEGFECRVRWSGICTITIRPQTLDVNGRVSPVVVLANALSTERHQATAALDAIPRMLGRELGQTTLDNIATLRRILKWPSPLLFLGFTLLSRKKNDRAVRQ